MIVAIHQPNYLPWLGFFYKLLHCDIFVLQGMVEYTSGITNRCKIKTSQGEKWLTIDVSHKITSINEMKVATSKWRRIHEKTLQVNYGKAPYFKNYSSLFHNVYSEKWNNIAQVNEAFIRLICTLLGVGAKIVLDSDLNVSGNKTELIINICKAVGGDTYLSGFGGKKYMDEKLFLENNIELKYSDFKHPVYNQLWGKFVPNMSIVDLLFNEGSRSLNILRCANG